MSQSLAFCLLLCSVLVQPRLAEEDKLTCNLGMHVGFGHLVNPKVDFRACRSHWPTFLCNADDMIAFADAQKIEKKLRAVHIKSGCMQHQPSCTALYILIHSVVLEAPLYEDDKQFLDSTRKNWNLRENGHEILILFQAVDDSVYYSFGANASKAISPQRLEHTLLLLRGKIHKSNLLQRISFLTDSFIDHVVEPNVSIKSLANTPTQATPSSWAFLTDNKYCVPVSIASVALLSAVVASACFLLWLYIKLKTREDSENFY